MSYIPILLIFTSTIIGLAQAQEIAQDFLEIPVQAAMEVGDLNDKQMYSNAVEYLNEVEDLQFQNECPKTLSVENNEEEGSKIIFSIRYMTAEQKRLRDDEAVKKPVSVQDFMNIMFQYVPAEENNLVSQGLSEAQRIAKSQGINLPAQPGFQRQYKFEGQLNELLQRKVQNKTLTYNDYLNFTTDILNDDSFWDLTQGQSMTDEVKQEVAQNMAYQLISIDLLFTPETNLDSKINALQKEDKDIIPKAYSAFFQTFNGRAQNKQTGLAAYVQSGVPHDMTGEFRPEAFIHSSSFLSQGINEIQAQSLLFQAITNGQGLVDEVKTGPMQFFLDHSQVVLDKAGYDSYLVINGISQKSDGVMPDLNLVMQDRDSKDIYSYETLTNERKNIPIATQYVYDLKGNAVANLPSQLSQYVDQMFPRRDPLNSLYTEVEQNVTDATISWQNFKAESGRYLGVKTGVAEFPDGSQSFVVAVNHQQYKRMIERPGVFLKGLAIALNTTLAGGASKFEGGSPEQLFVTIRHNNALVLELIESRFMKFGGLVGVEFEGSLNENQTSSQYYNMLDQRDLDAAAKINQGAYLTVTPNKNNTLSIQGKIQRYITPEIKPFIQGIDTMTMPSMTPGNLVSIKENGARVDVDYVRRLSAKAHLEIYGDFNFTKGGDRYVAGAGLTQKIGESTILSNRVSIQQNTQKNGMSVMDLISPNEGVFLYTDVQIRRLKAGTTIQLSDQNYFGVRTQFRLGK